jgi:hypothetical protein
MMVDDAPADPPHLLCLSMTPDEDRVLRELFKFPDGELVSDAEGDVPSLRRNLWLTISTDNLYGAISALRAEGYVVTTLVAQTDEWLRHYRPLRVRLTTRGRLHVISRPPVSNGITRALILITLAGVLTAAVAEAVGGEQDNIYLTIGLATAAAGIIALLARRAGKKMLGLY